MHYHITDTCIFDYSNSTLVLGMNDLMNSAQAKKIRQNDTGKPQLYVYDIVKMEADAHPDTVHAPIDTLSITQGGKVYGPTPKRDCQDVPPYRPIGFW